MSHRIAAIVAACQHFDSGDTTSAGRRIQRDYPFVPELAVKPKHGPTQATKVFVRDGFIDRYTGERLLFPPVLRVISALLPAEFPFHPNWKASVTHSAYWEVGASLDHLKPLSRGGADNESNWYTTSMMHNFAKMNWTLSDMGWHLHPPGVMADWDGLFGWFVRYTDDHPELVAKGSMRQWRLAADRAWAAL